MAAGIADAESRVAVRASVEGDRLASNGRGLSECRPDLVALAGRGVTAETSVVGGLLTPGRFVEAKWSTAQPW